MGGALPHHSESKKNGPVIQTFQYAQQGLIGKVSVVP